MNYFHPCILTKSSTNEVLRVSKTSVYKKINSFSQQIFTEHLLCVSTVLDTGKYVIK